MSRVYVYDTTLRDGSQGEGVNFSLQDKLLLTKKLDELGIDYIEGGYPLSNPKDFEYFQQVRRLELRHARYGAIPLTWLWRDEFGSTTWFLKSITFERSASGRVTGFVVNGSERARDMRFRKRP